MFLPGRYLIGQPKWQQSHLDKPSSCCVDSAISFMTMEKWSILKHRAFLSIPTWSSAAAESLLQLLLFSNLFHSPIPFGQLLLTSFLKPCLCCCKSLHPIAAVSETTSLHAWVITLPPVLKLSGSDLSSLLISAVSFSKAFETASLWKMLYKIKLYYICQVKHTHSKSIWVPAWMQMTDTADFPWKLYQLPVPVPTIWCRIMAALLKNK